jgi:hypothetical protein
MSRLKRFAFASVVALGSSAAATPCRAEVRTREGIKIVVGEVIRSTGQSGLGIQGSSGPVFTLRNRATGGGKGLKDLVLNPQPGITVMSVGGIVDPTPLPGQIELYDVSGRTVVTVTLLTSYNCPNGHTLLGGTGGQLAAGSAVLVTSYENSAQDGFADVCFVSSADLKLSGYCRRGDLEVGFRAESAPKIGITTSDRHPITRDVEVASLKIERAFAKARPSIRELEEGASDLKEITLQAKWGWQYAVLSSYTWGYMDMSRVPTDTATAVAEIERRLAALSVALPNGKLPRRRLDIAAATLRKACLDGGFQQVELLTQRVPLPGYEACQVIFHGRDGWLIVGIRVERWPL